LHETVVLLDGAALVALRLLRGFLREGARRTGDRNSSYEKETGDHETPRVIEGEQLLIDDTPKEEGEASRSG